MPADKKEKKDIIRIRMEAYDNAILDQSAQQIIDAAKRGGSEARGPIPLPTRIEPVSSSKCGRTSASSTSSTPPTRRSMN